MLAKLMKVGVGAALMSAFSAAQASAQTICILFWCFDIGGGSTGGGDHAPEIDATQGFAALSILVCMALVLREKFIRARQQA